MITLIPCSDSVELSRGQTIGYSGFSGYSGYSGAPGGPGASGASGISGFSGWSGQSGWSGISGYSGATGTVTGVTVGGDLTGTLPNPSLDLTKSHNWTGAIGIQPSTDVIALTVKGESSGSAKVLSVYRSDAGIEAVSVSSSGNLVANSGAEIDYLFTCNATALMQGSSIFYSSGSISIDRETENNIFSIRVPSASYATKMGLGYTADGVLEINSGTLGAFRDLALRNIISNGTATRFGTSPVNDTDADIMITASGDSKKCIVIQATGTQTSDLIQFQNFNGSLLSRFDFNGYWHGDGSQISNLQSSNLSGALPALDGSALVNLPIQTQIGTGTLDGGGSCIITPTGTTNYLIACYSNSAGSGQLYVSGPSMGSYSVTSAAGSSDSGKTFSYFCQ